MPPCTLWGGEEAPLVGMARYCVLVAVKATVANRYSCATSRLLRLSWLDIDIRDEYITV